jgi:hypothetical protein
MAGVSMFIIANIKCSECYSESLAVLERKIRDGIFTKMADAD